MNETIRTRLPLSLSDDSGNEVLRFDGVVLVGRVPKGILEGQEVEIGLVLNDSKISRVHARLTAEASGVLVEHLGSSNGTFVNDERVVKPRLARNGDRIRFDVLEHVLTDDRAPAATSEVPGAPASDPHGTVIRGSLEAAPTPPPSPSPPRAAPAPAPAPPPPPKAPVEAAPEDEGSKGGTILGAVRRDLPMVWLPKKAGTIIMEKGTLPEQRAIDIHALAAEVREPTLMVFPSNSEGYPYVLKCSGEINFWNIGKDPQNHDLSIVLEDPSVSGFHAKLVRRGDKWKIADQMSTNHTYVNGEIFASKYLDSQDRLRFGQVECVFLLPSARRPGAAAGRGLFARMLDALVFRWRR